MRLTSFTDFALRALMRLAGDPDRSFSTNDIAAEFGISRNHLIKVVRDLANGGFVITQRGAGGGFRLARAPRSKHATRRCISHAPAWKLCSWRQKKQGFPRLCAA